MIWNASIRFWIFWGDIIGVLAFIAGILCIGSQITFYFLPEMTKPYIITQDGDVFLKIFFLLIGGVICVLLTRIVEYLAYNSKPWWVIQEED
jgi:hypothetical protein